MRETAKLAMTRLHFSRGLRRAELSRSRTTTLTQQPKPGDIVYFYRDQKYKGRQAKRILALRRWHGPSLLVAWEGDRASREASRGTSRGSYYYYYHYCYCYCYYYYPLEAPP